MGKINQQLLRKLESKLGVKPRRAYELVEKEARATFLSRDLACIALAWRNGINVHSLTTEKEREEIRAAVARAYQPDSSDNITAKASLRKRKLRSRRQYGWVDPFVDAEIMDASIRNAELYPTVYVFENSVRRMLAAIMKKEFGPDWWETQVHPSIQQTVEIRRSEEKGYPWHSERAAEPIYYTDISDLRKIINVHNRVFSRLLGKIPRIELWVEEIEKTRNTLAHNNPVSKKDRDRLVVYARDWSEFAKALFQKFSSQPHKEVGSSNED